MKNCDAPNPPATGSGTLHLFNYFQNILYLLLAGIVILSIGLMAGCFGETNKPLRLGTNIWPGYEPLYMARDLGYLQNNVVRLVEYVSTSEVIRGFRNENIDAAALTLDEALLLSESGSNFKIVLVTDISNGGDAIVGKSEFSSIKDLVGKVVGVEGTALGAYVLTRALELNGLSLRDIRVRNLEVNEHVAAFTKGAVDAVVTFDPSRTSLLRQGARELFSSKEIPGEIVDVLVVRTAWFEAHRKQVAKLIDGWFRALKYLKASPQDAARRLNVRLKIGPEQVLNAYQTLKLPDRSENARLLTGMSPGLAPTAARLKKTMLATNLLAKPVQVGNLFARSIPGIRVD